MSRPSPLPRPWALLGALLWLVACGGRQEPPVAAVAPPASAPATAEPAPPSSSGPPRLLVVTAPNGYIEPCGCTVELTLGGIDRLATRIAEERRQGPTAVLMAGAVLFDPHVEDKHLADQESAKAQVLARALARIGVDAAVPTHADLKYGTAVLDPLRQLWDLPDVTVNVPGGAPRIVPLGPIRLGVFGLADPEGGPVPAGSPGPAEPAARAAVEKLRAEGAQVVVGLAALPRKPLRSLAKAVSGVDLWVLGTGANEETAILPVGETFVVEAGDRVRHYGRIVLHDVTAPGPLTDPAGERARALKALDLKIKMRADVRARTGEAALDEQIAAMKTERAALETAPLPVTGKRLEYALVPVAKEVVPEPALAGLIAAYNAKLKEIALSSTLPVPPVPEHGSGYAKGKNCIECHEEAQAVWLQTRHAHAWETLVKANKTFDAECVSCHVTGWLQPGGVNMKNLDGMTDVQCESCHGPGAKHVDVGGDDATTKRVVPAAVCEICHNRFHSPKFDYATYLPKVLGPGHAAKK